MADDEITVKDETEGAGTGNVDTKSLIGVGGKTVHRQITIIGSPATFGRAAEVNANSELLVKHTDAIPVTDNAGSLTIDNTNLDSPLSTKASEATLATRLADATFTGRINTQGQKTMAASTPIVVASDQSAVPISGTVTANAGTGTLNVDPTDKPARDLGKVDIALLDQYTPQDVDTGAPTVNALPIVLKKSAAGAPDLGTSTDPIRNDPTGTTTQPVSGTVTANAGTGPFPVSDNAGSLTVDAPVGTPVSNRLSDGAAFLTTTSGRLSVDASGVAVPVTDNAGTLTVDQATATNLRAEVVGPTADNAANPTAKLSVLPVKATAAAPTLTEGNVNPLSTDLSGRLRSDVSTWLGSTAPSVGSKTSANSVPVVVASDQGNVPVSQATAANLKDEPAGNVADAAADSGNPIKIGIVGRTTNRTAVTDGQRVNVTGDDVGRQVVILNQVRDLETHTTTTISTTTETTIQAAGAAGVFHDIVLITVANTSTTATRIDFRDVTAGAVIFSLYVPAGATIGFAPPVPVKQTTAANVWSAQLGTAVTDVRIFIQVVKNV